MRFTVLSERGDGLGLATHLSSEGHSVTMLVAEGLKVGAGMVNIVSESDDLSSDIIFYDCEEMGKDADRLRKTGKRVLGPSHWSQTIASDSEYAGKIIKLAGWDTDSVTNGVNLYITAWFNGSTFLSTYTSLVYRRFMSGGRGPDIAFTGVVSNFSEPTERITSEFLKPLEPLLRRVNHRGAFHIHTVIDKDRYSVKEISASFSSPLSLLLFENSKSSTADLLLRLFDERSKPIIPLEPWAAGIMLSIPPYPYLLDTPQVELKGIEAPAMKHLWLIDAMKVKDGWYSAGAHGKIGYVTARGENLHEATKRVYRTINNLEIRDLQFRDDVGRNLHDLLNTLRTNGWVAGKP